MGYTKEKGVTFGGIPLTSKALTYDASTEFLNQLQTMGLKKDNGENRNIRELADNYADQWGKVDDSVVSYVESVQEGNNKLKEGQTLLQGYKQQYTILGKFTTGLKDGIKSVVGGLGAALVSGFTTLAASFVISNVVKGVNSLRKSVGLLTKKEIAEARKAAIQAGKDAQKSIDDISTKTKQNTQTVTDSAKRYAELAQGVSNLGRASQNQGTLSTDEYSEFLDISNQLAELYPRLTAGYDENGNAILNLSGNVDTITQSLYDLVDAEKAVASVEMMEKMADVWGGYGTQVAEASKEYNDYTQKLNDLRSFEEEITSGQYGLYSLSSRYKDIYEDAGLTDRELEASWDELSETQQNNIKDAFARAEKEYSRQIDSFALQIESENKNLSNYLITAFQGDATYESLGEYKTIVNGLLSNVGYDTEFNELRDKGDWDTVKKLLLKDIIMPFATLTDKEKAEFQKYYNELLEIDTDAALSENIPKIQEYIEKLSEILGIESDKLSIALGFDVVGDQEKLNTARKRLGYKNDIPNSSLFDKPVELPTILTADEQSRNELIDDVVNSLDEEDIQFVIDNIDLDEIAKLNTKEEILDYIEELQKALDENAVEIPIKNSDAVKDLNDLDSAWSGLDTVYSTTKTGGTAEAKDIESVNSAFGGVSKAGDEEINSLTNAIEAYDTVLVESKGDTEEAQKAVNKLTTAYIDQSGILNDLDESNTQYYIDMLTSKGITNAEEVVMSRLSDTAKRTAKNLKELSKALVNNYDTLKSSSKGSEEYNNSMSEIKDATANLFSYEQDGNIITPTLSDEFILQNLEDIRLATEGDIDALSRLRVEAAKEIAANVSIKGNYGEVQAIEGEINSLIDGFNIEDVEVGAYLDDTQMIRGLNNLVESGKITRDAMNSILGAIGIEPEISYTTAKVDVSTSDIVQMRKNGKTLEDVAAYAHAKTDIKIPRIRYKNAGGVGATYGGSKSTSSSGGGGGGGGGSSSSEPNKPKEESEEMFDWVEVAIQRLKEQQQRLDKTVGNTYTLWTKRNEALSKEINTVTQEIKAQQLAQQEYQKYLNSIKVNNGKGLNDDDYGENDELVKQADQALLDEANRLWATGEYQKKIMEGMLSGDDIEKIANHFLTETIQEYQEFYQKVVDAGDAVQDLTIKLGELAETKFDNIQSEYDELIAYVTAYADIIDERINRTEEHGYFVSKDYYRQLIEYENQQLAKLNSEYGDLIKARDEAVAAGYITEGSSAWNNMNQEILAVEKSIEESTTALVEFNNNIRDLDWEIFDWLEERISRITDEAEFLVDLMSNDKLYEDDGRLTNLGQATNGLYAIQYETLMRQAQDYAEERLKLEREIAKDPANKDLIERYEELVDAQQDAVKGAEDMKNAVKDLVEEAINLHLSKLDELIDKYETALDKEKDLYEYSKNIDKQIKNINNLERMLNAYSGDDSEEARKIRQQTANSLEEARQQLEETEWDRMISETKELLTDMRDDYEEVLMARLDDVDALMHDMIENANENTGVIKDTIATETDKVGYILTDPLNKILNDTSTNTLVSNFMSKFESAATSVQSVLETIKQYVYSMTDTGKAEVEAERQAKIKAAQQAETQRQAEAQRQAQAQAAAQAEAQRKAEAAKQAQAQQSTASSSPQGDGVPNVGDKVTFASGRYYEDSYGNGRSGSKYQGQEVYITKINSKGSKPYHISTGSTLGSGNLGWVTLDQLRGYMMGSRRIPYNQLAWTQENGSEMIYRSSDGAMLTPLGTGDMVFTKEMSQRLYDLAGSDIPTIKSNTSKPNVQSTVGNNVTNQNAISFTLPNVKNYDEFIREMKRDNRFQGFIQEITFGQANGNNSLNKNKF